MKGDKQLTKDDVTLFTWGEVPSEQMNAMLSRQIITGERSMLARVQLAKGCVVPKHSHDNEQFTLILAGALRFRIGEEGREVVVRTGEVLHIPSGVLHEAEALEDTDDLDVFTPPRQDWLDGTDSYLRG